MKKLKISLIAIALIIGGVQAYGGMRFTTYYCAPLTPTTSNYFTVASSSPGFACGGGTLLPYVCTFSTNGSFTPGQVVASSVCTTLTSYED
ncbi:hypothetical protein [Chitinophaga deserti]|uniref:hypothetical protein n=1 Tax=Chitinophaga deserti TaxID=2164099 RepID=UPI001300440A|nr:hypothetical protein [Chitinophaga deserti]